MSSQLVNRAFTLRRRPRGLCTAADLQLVREEVDDLKPGQALVRTLYLSLDPTVRLWMSDHRSFMPAVPVGAVMRGIGMGQVVESRRGIGMGQVVESRRDDLPAGALVSGGGRRPPVGLIAGQIARA